MPHRRSRRDLLLDEAARQLNGCGISQTALSDIAQGLGLSRAALYYYVEDRQDLVFQCYRRASEAMARDLAAAARAAGDGLTRLAVLVERSLDPDRIEEAVPAEIAYLNDEQRRTVESLRHDNLCQLRDLIEAGQKQGDIRACDSEIIGQALVGMISWIPLAPRWSGDDAAATKARACAATIDLLRHGIAADPDRIKTLPRIDVGQLRPARGNLFSREDAAAMKVEELLRTASRLFNRKGIDATSLDEIGAAVGATKSVVYHYLRDKQELVAQCYRRAFDLGGKVLDAIERYDGSGLERSLAGFRLLVEINARAEFSPLAPLVGIDALHPEAHAEIIALVRASQEAFPAVVEAGIADGSVRRIDIRAAANALAGAFGWIPKWFAGENEAMVDRIADEFTQLYAFGLAVRS